MNVIDVSEKIQGKIAEIDKFRKVLRERAEKKAQTVAEYDKQIALILMGLRNGKSYELDGEKITDPPTTIMEKIAKGICWKEKLEMDTAEVLYKSVITNLDCVCSQLNGFQSINRYLEKA